MSQALKALSTKVVIGLRRSHVDLVVHRAATEKQPDSIRARTVRWRLESSTLASDAGQRELQAALQELIAEERLQGSNVYLSLSGDFCVTRVVTGPADRVQRELSQLEQRSALYLSLGTGLKTLAVSVRQVDARHQHALLTVANQKILNAIVTVVSKLGLKLELIEPSLVAISRALGHTERDHDQPVMIVHMNEQGVELGISHRGQLLLDYRPGGRSAREEIPGIVTRHRSRLERYCQRYFRFTNASIENVYLCGPKEANEFVQEGFKQHGLTVEILDSSKFDTSWQFSGVLPESEASGALGTSLLAQERASFSAGPNLADRLAPTTNRGQIKRLISLCWPIAASLLLAAGIGVTSLYERYRCSQLEEEIASYDEHRAKVDHVKNHIRGSDRLIAGHNALVKQIPRENWHDLFDSVAKCLPDDVWLESVAVDTDDRLRLAGVSYGEDGMYEFIQWLKKYPRLESVSLEETGRAVLASGPVTKFTATATLQPPLKSTQPESIPAGSPGSTVAQAQGHP